MRTVFHVRFHGVTKMCVGTRDTSSARCVFRTHALVIRRMAQSLLLQ